jgi:hypothetical protein
MQFFEGQNLMSLDIEVEVLPKFVQIELSGEYTFSDLMEQVEKFRSEADKASRNHILIDARSVQGKMTESEKFFVGTRIAEVFGARLKTAVIVPPGNVTKMGEMAAINRGARLFVTESEGEAIDWLERPSALGQG